MANYKKITAAYITGATVYCMVSRDADGYFLATAKTSFASGAGYPAMTEDATVKGLYVLNTNDAAWDDGSYTIVAYCQTGASPSPAGDVVIAHGSMRISDDMEVQKLKVDLVRLEGAAVADGSNTASTFKTSLASSTNDTFTRAWLKFTSGDLVDQVSKISAYNGATKFITVTDAFTGAPSDGDDFVIVNE